MTRYYACFRLRRISRDALVIFAFLSTPLAESAFAQETSSMQLGLRTPTHFLVTSASTRAPNDTASKRGRYTLRGMLIGTAIGATIGGITAYRSTRGNYLDHTEDGLLYLLYPLYGGVAGLLLGGIVGFVWK